MNAPLDLVSAVNAPLALVSSLEEKTMMDEEDAVDHRRERVRRMSSTAAKKVKNALLFRRSAVVVDPLVEEEKRMAANLKDGFSTLLDMHNPAELGSLCGSLGLVEECEYGTHGEKKQGILQYLKKEGSSEKAYA